jgi:hypothetical protein
VVTPHFIERKGLGDSEGKELQGEPTKLFALVGRCFGIISIPGSGGSRVAAISGRVPTRRSPHPPEMKADHNDLGGLGA